jgi:hypothetical protein
MLPHVLAPPGGERVHLHEPEPPVPLDHLRVGAVGGLIAADPGHPGAELRERRLERADLARRAAGVRVRLPGRDPRHDRRQVRLRRADGDAVPLLEARPEGVGLGEEVARVEREDRDGEARAADHVHEQAVLRPEAAGEPDPSGEPLGGGGQDLLRRLALERRGERGERLMSGRAHRIIPAPTVSFVVSSTTMKAPVARFSA